MNTSDVLNRIAAHRLSQRETVDYVRIKSAKVADKLAGCGTWLHFREWLDSGETRLRNANFCKNHLLCRACAARRAGKLVTAYTAKVQQIMQHQPALIPVMVTITVANGEDLQERVKHLKMAWTRMLERKRKGASKSGRHSPVEWNKVVGSLRSLEVTKGEGGWHPHFHVFALLSDYLDQAALSAEWENLTGDSFIVGVSKCKGGIVPGLIECLKYATKFSELAPAEAWHVAQELHGSRCVDAQGVLRGVPEPDLDQDDAEGLLGPYRDFVAIWCAGKQHYALAQVDEYLTPKTHLEAKALEITMLEEHRRAGHGVA